MRCVLLQAVADVMTAVQAVNNWHCIAHCAAACPLLCEIVAGKVGSSAINNQVK
jgi:hypothetical protein